MQTGNNISPETNLIIQNALQSSQFSIEQAINNIKFGFNEVKIDFDSQLQQQVYSSQLITSLAQDAQNTMDEINLLQQQLLQLTTKPEDMSPQLQDLFEQIAFTLNNAYMTDTYFNMLVSIPFKIGMLENRIQTQEMDIVEIQKELLEIEQNYIQKIEKLPNEYSANKAVNQRFLRPDYFKELNLQIDNLQPFFLDYKLFNVKLNDYISKSAPLQLVNNVLMGNNYALSNYVKMLFQQEIVEPRRLERIWPIICDSICQSISNVGLDLSNTALSQIIEIINDLFNAINQYLVPLFKIPLTQQIVDNYKLQDVKNYTFIDMFPIDFVYVQAVTTHLLGGIDNLVKNSIESKKFSAFFIKMLFEFINQYSALLKKYQFQLEIPSTLLISRFPQVNINMLINNLKPYFIVYSTMTGLVEQDSNESLPTRLLDLQKQPHNFEIMSMKVNSKSLISLLFLPKYFKVYKEGVDGFLKIQMQTQESDFLEEMKGQKLFTELFTLTSCQQHMEAQFADHMNKTIKNILTNVLKNYNFSQYNQKYLMTATAPDLFEIINLQFSIRDDNAQFIQQTILSSVCVYFLHFFNSMLYDCIEYPKLSVKALAGDANFMYFFDQFHMTPGMYLPGFSEIIKAMIHKGSSNHIHFEEIIKYCKLPQDNFNEGKRIASLLVTVKQIKQGNHLNPQCLFPISETMHWQILLNDCCKLQEGVRDIWDSFSNNPSQELESQLYEPLISASTELIVILSYFLVFAQLIEYEKEFIQCFFCRKPRKRNFCDQCSSPQKFSQTIINNV